MDKEQLFISYFDSKLIGDDGAIDKETIYSSDMFFEDVHFKREWMSLYQIARKSMLVNISDAIAMSALPKKALLNIQLPKNLSEIELRELADGFIDSAKEFGCEIVGGDTIGGEKLNIAITIISESKNPLRRDSLQEEAILAFTGELGESLRDLNRLLKGEQIPKDSKFINPTLRADFIYKAREHLLCGMDISDGLFCDTNKLLDSNNLGLELFFDIPDEVGFSGEEYEMIIAFKEKEKDRVLKIAKETKTPLTIFGKAKKNSFRFPCKSHHF